MCADVLRQPTGRLLDVHPPHPDVTQARSAMAHHLGEAFGWLPDELLAGPKDDTWLPHRHQPHTVSSAQHPPTEASPQLAPWPRRLKSALYEPQHTHTDPHHHNRYYHTGSHTRHDGATDTQLAHHDWLHDWEGFDHPRRSTAHSARPVQTGHYDSRHELQGSGQARPSQPAHHGWAHEVQTAPQHHPMGGRRQSWGQIPGTHQDFGRHPASNTPRYGADEHEGQWLGGPAARASEQGYGGHSRPSHVPPPAGPLRRRASVESEKSSWLGSDLAQQQRPAHGSSPAYPRSPHGSSFPSGQHRPTPDSAPQHRDEAAHYSPQQGTATLGDGLWDHEHEPEEGGWGQQGGTSSVRSSGSEQGELQELELLLGQADREARPYVCSFKDCGQAFAHPGPLRSHELQHVGDRPYFCTQQPCPATFSTADALRAHQRTHLADRPYRCPVPQCTAAFRQSSGLKMHIRTHTGERPFKCNFAGCTSAFKRSSQLKLHKRIHTGEKPYVCAFEGCTARFSCPRNFSAHKRTHTGEKPYHCSYPGCDAAFGRSSSLTRHMKVHTRGSHLPPP